MQPATFSELIEDAIQVLIGTGNVIAPRQEAQALAAHVFGADAEVLPPDGRPDDASSARFAALLDRRADGVPLGHLTGVATLGGVEVLVGPGVFVPRAQSEAVLAHGLAVTEQVMGPLVVDLGTGSGALALAVAHRRPDATVHAVDCDPPALDYARRNSERRVALGDTPIVLHEADFAGPELLAELDGTVDLVLANPPFMPDEAQLPPEFGVHQPQLAVFGGPDGLDVIRQTVQTAGRLLAPGGSLVLEHGHLHAEAVAALLGADDRFGSVSGHLDQYGYPLFTAAARNHDGAAG
ncbi:release factor glutamine methyltransferase [Kitasatospora sp. MAP12-15]|uniref:N5-glutamine methyltransferase family protein n=1 Tax=unclassified Kitasatospora TaxID=2633591 RepID=UPI002475FB84|nr:HemK/PrmC family methyltransferase [Kitasatospora sp. MAP12-44]MDH6114875.1 release factor glutamine methyltransferase [Kitasatospora sp. MAP12-44]